MIQFIRRAWLAFKFKRAVRKAKNLHEITGYKYYVILMNDRMHVIPKSTIKTLVLRHRFKKGVTVRDIEKRALFVTL